VGRQRSRHKRALGERAEQTAFRYLIEQGLSPVARNFRSRGGEIDLIMLDGSCLTFVEVRCRRNSRFAAPGDTVDSRKQRKIIRTAALFSARNRHYAAYAMRFDVVAIEGDTELAIRWIRDAFRPGNSTF